MKIHRSENNSQIINFMLLTIGFSIVAILNLMIHFSSSQIDYLSIYDEQSVVFWILLITTISIGITIAMVNLKNKFWIMGLSLILISNLIVLLLTYLNGFMFSGQGDHLTHYGFVKNIISNGSIGSGNIYPHSHILLSELTYFGYSLRNNMFFVAPIYYFNFVFFNYLLSKQFLNRSGVILSTLVSTVLVMYYYVQIFPLGLALMLFPMFFYIYFRYRENKSMVLSILLVMMLFVLTVSHPVAAAVLIVALLIIEFSNRFIYKLKFNSDKNFEKVEFTIALLLLVLLISWIWNNAYVWENSVETVVNWFSFELLTAPFTQAATEGLNKLNLSDYEIVTLFFKKYGVLFIYFVLSVFLTLQVLMKKNYSNIKNKLNFTLYLIFFITSMIIWLSDYFFPLTTLSSGRMICVALAVFPVFVGLALSRILDYDTFKENLVNNKMGNILVKLKFPLVTLILIAVSVIAIFSLYPSPIVYTVNDAVSGSQYSGSAWFINYGNVKNEYRSLGTTNLYRFKDAMQGSTTTTRKIYEKPLPDHFNYNETKTLGEYLKKRVYLVSRNSVILSLYDEGGMYSELGRFKKEDFTKLDSDLTVNKLYENGEVNVYLIN